MNPLNLDETTSRADKDAEAKDCERLLHLIRQRPCSIGGDERINHTAGPNRRSIAAFCSSLRSAKAFDVARDPIHKLRPRQAASSQLQNRSLRVIDLGT